MSSNLKDLLSKLLTVKPEKRIGYKKGISEILKHAWFKGVNAAPQNSKISQPPVTVDPRRVYFTGREFTIEDLKTLKSTPSNEKEIANFLYFPKDQEVNTYIPKIQEIIRQKNINTVNTNESTANLREEAKALNEGLALLRSKKSENFQQINEEFSTAEKEKEVSMKIGKYSSKAIKLPGSFSLKGEEIYPVSAV
eukprot:CAMPEP_0176465834 /NCGR_PEP_ID=MMETSP0127-20121128/37529_1 /TAXON_ID=938130 /ORGANISM="Platyophrya macrostoma, Strain WH" /LENGTH=194 /DNA_ID=CAMNT_0017858879 /DNA_START=184 /DNA_END=768 /DNA_ORIENTATION=+